MNMNNSNESKDLKPKNLMTVPDDVLEKVMSFISYDEVSRCRLVCRRFNSVSQRVLNRGFHRVEKYHAQCLKKVKAQLPRRESERRKHHLARHCDILTAVETRLSLLSMTFLKFIDLSYCCFIPGKVLDEIYKVLRYVTTETSPVRAHEVLQELRDLSSMAMEYFDEKIAPNFKKHKDPVPKIVAGISFQTGVKSISKSSNSPLSNHEANIQKMSHYVRQLVSKLNHANKEITALQIKCNDLSRKDIELERQFMEQQRVLALQDQKIKDHDNQLIAISKHLKLQFNSEIQVRVPYIKLEPDVHIKTEITDSDIEPNNEGPSTKRKRLSSDFSLTKENTGLLLEPGTSETSIPIISVIKLEKNPDCAPQASKVVKEKPHILKVLHSKRVRRAIHIKVEPSARRPITRSFTSKKVSRAAKRKI